MILFIFLSKNKYQIEKRKYKHLDALDEVALLPKELSVPVSKENTALVSKHERRALIGMS